MGPGGVDQRIAVLTEMFRVSHNAPSTPFRAHTGEVQERTIWAYWAQGYGQMPEFFKLCVDTWRHHNPDWDVRVLERNNLYEFLSEADLPNRFNHMLSHQIASDAIRLALLARYGGVWLDVSVLLNEPLDDLCWNQIEEGEVDAAAFFHPHYGTEALQGKDFIESWFLATRQGNPFFIRWRDLLKELMHNRLDIEGLLEHPLYQGLDLSGIDLLNKEHEFRYDFREYLAIHSMCHRIIETDEACRDQWDEWLKLDAADTAFKIQLTADEKGTTLPMAFLSGAPEWDEVARGIPLVKFTTPHYVHLVMVPRKELLDERGLLGRWLSEAAETCDSCSRPEVDFRGLTPGGSAPSHPGVRGS